MTRIKNQNKFPSVENATNIKESIPLPKECSEDKFWED
jgi:hypothetical protein